VTLIRASRKGEEFLDCVWSSDDDLVPERTWQWWFWLFFIKGGDKPRQIMTLWSSRECKHIMVNDDEILNGGLISRSDNEDILNGAAATWFFDGTKMDEYFKTSNIHIRRGKTNEISTADRGHVFSGGLDRFRVVSRQPDYDFRLKRIRRDDHELERVNYPFGMNFKIAKANCCELNGTLLGEKVDGYAYFQKVVCNAPATSWYWSINHFDNDALLTYFAPTLGMQNFNFSSRHRASVDIPLKKRCAFHIGKKTLQFDKFSLKRTGGELPVWLIEGKGEDGTISAELTTYARARWRFKSGRGLRPVLQYNEYPTTVTALDINGGEITLKDLGDNYGYTEHTWGTLL